MAGEVPYLVLGAAAGLAATGNLPPHGGRISSDGSEEPIGNYGQLKRQYTSGRNRICIYGTRRGDYTTTVGFAERCPLISH